MVFDFDEFELDADTRELRRCGNSMRVDAVVLRLLTVLVRNASKLVSKQDLMTQVWDDRAVAENVLTVAMARLRKTLGHKRGGREFVHTVHGVGYRFARPVHARETSAGPRERRAGSDDASLLFVGREAILDSMRSALNGARSGHGSACLLIGEPGIGKTRAAEMLEREALAEGLSVAWGHCPEAGETPPLWPFALLARGLLAKFPIESLRSRLGSAAFELERLLPELRSKAHPKPAEPDEGVGYSVAAKHRIFDAITLLFALIAERTPCVLVLDDLHRADAASLELLHYVIDAIAHVPLLLVGTLRRRGDVGTDRANADPARAFGHRNCQRIVLERLHEEDVISYARAVLGDPDGTLGRALFAKSEGNPFFMVELSRQLRYAERPDPSVLAVPDAARELIRQRISALGDTAREVLGCAAVIGRSFELPLLQLVSARQSGALMACLDDAAAREVITVAHGSRTGFAFGHDLLRAVLYDAIPPADRRALHLRVGQALEQRMAAGDAVVPSELAYHFHAALPESDLKKTVEHCASAAQAAAHVHASADVLRYLRQALEALELKEHPNPDLRLQLLLLQALHLRGCASVDFTNVIHNVIDVAREQKAGVPLALAALLLDPIPGFPPSVRSREASHDALRLLSEEDRGPRVALLARLAMAAPLAYDAGQSGEQLTAALELNRSTRSNMAKYAVCMAQLYLTGGPEGGRVASSALRELESLCHRHPARFSNTPVLLELHRAIVALQRGKLRATNTALERCEHNCRELDSRELLWHVERLRIVSRINTGVLTQAAADLVALHRRAEQAGAILGSEVFCAYDRAVVLAKGTAPQPSDPLLRTLAVHADDPPGIWSMRVRGLEAAGLHEDARAALARVSPDDLAKLPRDRDYVGTLGALARTALALRAMDYIEALHGLLTPYPRHFAAHASFLCEGSVSTVLGMLAYVLDHRAEAIAQLEAGIGMSEQAGLVVCAIEARFELARCLLDRGSRAEQARASALHEVALSDARRLGLARLAASKQDGANASGSPSEITDCTADRQGSA